MNPFKILLVYPNLQLINLIPTNIGLLSACLKQEGFDVKVFDTTLYKTQEQSEDERRVELGHYKSTTKVQYKKANVFADFKKLVKEYKPNFIGVSTVDSTHELGVKLIEAANPECSVIFGGVYPTFAPHKVISHPCIDYVCVGEGEEALVNLVKAYRDGIPWNSNNIITNNNPEIKMGHVVDLNRLPNEDFTVFDDERFLRPMQGKDKRMLPIMIDRGCPYKCSFCAEPNLKKLYNNYEAGNNFRVKKLPVIKKYMKQMISKYKPEYIYFNSETFFARPENHIEEFANFYKNEINLPFCCMTRIETITDRRIKALKDMGCDRISFGLEHGNEKFRKDVLDKPFTNKQIYDGFKILSKYEIPVSLFNIIGFPDETRELIFDTIKINQGLIKQYPENKITFSVSIFQPYQSAPLRSYCIKKGYLDRDTEAGSLTTESILDMPQLPAKEINGLLRTFTLYVQLPKSFYPDIKKAETCDKTFEKLRKILLEKF